MSLLCEFQMLMTPRECWEACKPFPPLARLVTWLSWVSRCLCLLDREASRRVRDSFLPHHGMSLSPVPYLPAFLGDTVSTPVHPPSLLHSKQLPTEHLSAASLPSQGRKLRPCNYDIPGVILTISHYSKTTDAVPICQHKEMILTSLNSLSNMPGEIKRC